MKLCLYGIREHLCNQEPGVPLWTELILPQRQDSQYDGVLYNCTENTADARHDESLNSIEVTRPRARGIVSNKIEGG